MTYLTIFIFIFAIPFHSLVAKTEESTGASLTHSNASTEKTHELLPSSPFADCEGQVSLLAKKYYGDSRSANFFHRMIACAGMEGDPLKRKGWKHSEETIKKMKFDRMGEKNPNKKIIKISSERSHPLEVVFSQETPQTQPLEIKPKRSLLTIVRKRD